MIPNRALSHMWVTWVNVYDFQAAYIEYKNQRVLLTTSSHLADQLVNNLVWNRNWNAEMKEPVK